MKTLIVLATLVAISLACSDRYSSCSRYDKKRYCSHSWLKQNCAKYCGYCSDTPVPPTQAPGCQDKSTSCRHYTKYCSYHSWVKANCKKTCNLCGGVTTNPPVTSRPGTNPPAGSCGRSNVAQSRVVGGKDANAHSWPWQIGLHRNGGFMCGGSVVNSKWIVTAAHCVHRRRAAEFKVKLGDHDRRRNEGEQFIQVSRIITHPGYGNGRLNNDIALLELAQPVKFGQNVQPVCLPNQGDAPRVGSQCYITGWGKIRHPGYSHTILQQLALTIQDKATCSRMNSKYAPITDQMLCAANPKVSKNQSGCHGDSGGPFVCESNGSWTLHGAVSWGSPRCDIKDAFTVFARVGQFRTWIDQYIN